ncbi:MAG: A24 family peptidase [Phycisphaeraceae bacterium]
MTSLFEHPGVGYQWGAVVGASLVAAFWDWRCRRIPNLLTGPLLVAGLASAVWAGGWWGLTDACVACIMLAFPYVLLFVFAGGGAGDAKMMGAVGAWLGSTQGVVVLVAVVVVGCVMGLALACLGRRRALIWRNLGLIAFSIYYVACSPGRVKQLKTLLPAPAQSQAMPYGLAICGGVVLGGGVLWIWPL